MAESGAMSQPGLTKMAKRPGDINASLAANPGEVAPVGD